MSDLINDLHSETKQPVFYVTSSPWNLHGFLGRVFKRAQLPKGGIFMTDWGLTPKQWLTPSHDVHKGDAIKRISGWYQDSQFLLFGDDSQHDHTIYADFIRSNPDKIKAAFIRTVAGEEKMAQVQQMMDALNQELGREVMFVIRSVEDIRDKLADLL
jgi:phosphatidate phosphatase APP1